MSQTSLLRLDRKNSSTRMLKQNSSTVLDEHREWERKSLMSGTSVEKLKVALSRHQTDVGPGQYESQTLIGGFVTPSKNVNFPKYSLGSRRKSNVVNPETRNLIMSPHKTPGPDVYSYPRDNIYYN